MKKGITPIIAIIVLLLITIALAGAAWTYLQGFLFSQITKTFNVPPNSIYCSGTGASRSIKVYVQNTGYQSVLDSVATTGGDFIIAEVDGTDRKADLVTVSVEPGKSAKVLDSTCGGSGCSTGQHTVRIGTGSTVVVEQVNCV
jgi:flagellin-like protein